MDVTIKELGEKIIQHRLGEVKAQNTDRAQYQVPGTVGETEYRRAGLP